VDEQLIQDLIRQLQELIPALKQLGQTSTTASPSKNDGTDKIVMAIAKLSAKLDKNTTSKTQENLAMAKFTKDIDQAADAAEQLAKQQQAAATTVSNAAKAQALAQQRASMTTEQLQAEEKKARQSELKEKYEELRQKRESNTNWATMHAQEEIAQRRAGTTFRAGLEKLAGDSVGAQKGIVHFQEALKQAGDVGKSLGKFAGELGEGSTKFTTLNPLLDTMANVLGKLAESIPYAGSAISGTIKATAEASKFVINQLQKSVEAFNELGQVGALTAKGMSGVQEQFLASGLSLDGFKKSITENSTTLARFRGLVGAGAEDFSKITGSLLDQRGEFVALGDDLRRIGLSADQIGESTGAYVQQQTRLGLAQNKTNRQLAQGSAEYIKELDVLTKITGMNRKEVQAQQDAALSEGRFRAQYDDMVANGQEKAAEELLKFQTQVSKLAPELGAAIRDVSTDFANSDAAKKGFSSTGGALQDIVARLKNNDITRDQAMKELQNSTKAATATQRGFAKAVGDGQDVFIKYSEISDLNNATITDGILIAKEVQDKQTAGSDGLTNSAVDAQKAMEQMSRQIQNFGFTAMPKATTAVQSFTTSLNKFVAYVAEKTGTQLTPITSTDPAPTAQPGPAPTAQPGPAPTAQPRTQPRTQPGTQPGAQDTQTRIASLEAQIAKYSKYPESNAKILKRLNEEKQALLKQASQPAPIATPSATPTTAPTATPTTAPTATPPTVPLASPENQSAPKTSSLPQSVASKQYSDLNTYLKKIAIVESGGQKDAKAKGSSASGLFQFTEGTWQETTKKMGKNYSLEDRFDPKKSAEVAAYFTQQQRTQLEKGTGKTASDADLYMAHFLGAGGATKFLNALSRTPDAPASTGASPDQINANPTIFKDKTGQERTLQEVYNLMGGKMDRGGVELAFGSSNVTKDVKDINVQSARLGGVLSGPMSGYPAQLHGPEAVVPLPDGRTIPVELKDQAKSSDADSFKIALDGLRQDLSRMMTSTSISPELVSLMSQLVDLQRTNNSTAQRMLQASQG
jgi:hypothetical protein